MKKILILTLSLFFAIALVAQTTEINQQQLPIENNTELSLLQKVENWYSQNMSYTTITILMTVESSFIPFPSEIVVPPAAYIASQPGSHLNIYLVVLFATIGALLGALINYFGAIYLGRPIVYKFANSKLGHMFLAPAGESGVSLSPSGSGAAYPYSAGSGNEIGRASCRERV